MVDSLSQWLGDLVEHSDGWGWLWLGLIAAGICALPGVARGIVYGDWTSFGRIAAALGLLALVVGAWLLWRWLAPSEGLRRGRRLEALFREHGLELESPEDDDRSRPARLRALGDGRRDAPTVVGEWRGRRVCVRRSSSGDDRAIYEVDLGGDLPDDLVIQPRSAPTMGARWVSWERLEIGSEPFRESYTVRAQHPDRVTAEFHELELDTLFAEELSDDAPTIRLESGVLKLVQTRETDSLETAEAHLERLDLALARVDRKLDGDS